MTTSQTNLRTAILMIFVQSIYCSYLLANPLQAGKDHPIAKGKVYHDVNGNGILDAEEPGIGGILVTNGREIVKTDSDGSYSMPLEKDGILFVIKPKGYRTAVDARNIPRFYYLHRPDDATCKQYPGMAPTGPLPETIDFPLTIQNEPETFTMLLFGDTQPKNITHVDYLSRDVVDELAHVQDVAFGVTLGDVVDDDLTLFDPVSDAVARIGIPWFNVLGNHDMNFDVPGDEGANQTFEARYGPATYSFNYANVHFLVLDDVVYKGYNPTPSGYVGGFTPKILEFIKNDLEHVSKDQLIVLMMHIPIFTESWSSKSFRIEDRKALFDLLEPFPHTFSISAHTHIQRHVFFKEEDGWHGKDQHHHYNAGTACGSWWSGEPDEAGIPHTTMRDGTPNGYAFVRFSDNQFIVDYKAAREPADHQMTVFAPRTLRRGEFPNGRLYVNFFMGNERTRVFSRLDFEKEWKEMRKTLAPDPYMNALYVKYDLAPHPLPGPRLGPPSECHHLWSSSIPTHMPPGLHSYDIKVVDMWGREYQSGISFRME